MRTNEGVLVGELQVKADEVEESDESCCQYCRIPQEASRDEGEASNQAFVESKTDQDEGPEY